jgi:peptide/nickel transport system permease protein
MAVEVPTVNPEGIAPAQSRSAGVWRVGLARLMSDRVALIAFGLFLLIIGLTLAAPLYAKYVAHTDPFHSNIDGEIDLDGQSVPVIQASTEGMGLGQTPIGPTWHRAYFLGADNQGRDIAARILFGGRYSLAIAGAATLICLALGALVGVVAGYFGGLIDIVLSRILDVLWAFPVYLLAISLSIVLISKGIEIGPITIDGGSLFLPIVIIGVIFVPYVARPIRAQVLTLKHSDFVLAAIGFGVPSHRILLFDILPNVSTTLIVFVPLMMALNMLTESALSFLSIGVQEPNASWGTIIQDGLALLYTRPLVALAPGLAIALSVLALNVFGDGLRDALDPRSKLRIRAV